MLYQFLPRLSDDEYRDLEASIREHGVQVPIVVDENRAVIDGHHRKEIAERLGVECPRRYAMDLTDEQKRTLALSLNLHRRHLTREQKRALVEASIKADPHLSDRQHADRTGVSPTTAGKARSELEVSGEVSKMDTRTGRDGVKQPASKPEYLPAPEPEPEFVSATEALATLGTQDASPDAEDPAPVEQESDEAPADVQPEGEGAPSSATEVPSNASPRPPATVTGIDGKTCTVTSIDGKTYLRPVPASRPKPAADEFTDHDRAEELARNLARNLSLLYALTSPERRAEYIATWREGTADLKPLGWDFITPAHMRELSAALLDFASEWEKAHA